MGDRLPDAFLSSSRAAAVVRADGLSSMTARRAGPFRFTSSIRAKYAYIKAERQLDISKTLLATWHLN